MNDPSTLASLSWSELTSAPAWQGLDVVGRAQVVNEYYGALGNSLTGTDRDTVENRDKLNARRRERLYEVAPLLRQPEDIGTMENVSNAFTKSLNSFHENIALNLIQQNPEEARRFHASLEAQYPTREGFGETLGRVTGMVLPTGAALISAPITGPMGLTGAAAVAAGAIYGATSAGSALGDIYQYEQATGDDVSSGKTAAVMAGHAIFEMATEMAGFHFLLGGARRIGQNLTESTAETVGRHLLNNERRQLARASADAMADFFTYNKKAAFALGWAKMGLIEGVEEASSQILQNFTDRLYRESNTLEGVVQSFREGALGGLLLGPLAMGMHASAYTAQKDRMARAGVNILDDALKVQARREAGAGANEQVIADIYTSLRNEYDAESPIDRAALDDADFMALKEFFGMAGIEALPVRGSSAGRGKGAQMTASDGTPIILVDTGVLAGFDGVRNFVTAHEGYHAIDKLLGREGSITLAREIAASVPEFAKYKATLDSAHAAAKLAAPSETYTQNEAVADIFGQVFFKPQFLGAAIDAAVKNPAIGREVVRTLKDMRSRFERMGRRLDAQMEYSRTAWAEAKAADEARVAAQSNVDESHFTRPGLFYRVVVGEESFRDIINSGLIRTNPQGRHENAGGTLLSRLADRPTAFPSFRKDGAALSYARGNPNHYIMVTSDASMRPSELGRHGKGSTYFPTTENGTPATSMPAANVSVYKHVGNQQYQLVKPGDDIQFAEQRKLEAAGVPILRLPRAAMEIAKAKIDGDITALDRMSVQFIKSFETSLARQAEPAKAKVVTGAEPPEDLLGREAAPMSVVESARDAEYMKVVEAGDMVTARAMVDEAAKAGGLTDTLLHGSNAAVMAGAFEIGKRDPGWFGTGAYLTAYEAYAERWGKHTHSFYVPAGKYARISVSDGYSLTTYKDEAKAAHENAGGSNQLVENPQDYAARFSRYLRERGFVGVKVEMDGYADAEVVVFDPSQIKSADAIVRDDKGNVIPPSQRFNPASDDIRYSIRETPDEIFNRAFDKDATAFRASDEAKALNTAWQAKGGTSFVLDKVFAQNRFSAPPVSPDTGSAAARLWNQWDSLPMWAKARPQDTKTVEWGRKDFFKNFGTLLGVNFDPAETAMNFLQTAGLEVAEGDTGTNEDHVLEALAFAVRGFEKKGAFRDALAGMAKDELKPHLDDLARRRVSKDIDARRITQRLKRMYDVVKPGTINRIVNEPTMNVTESLVSRDDLKIDDVIRQKDNLFVVDGFNPDRSPIVTPLRASAPFDTTPGAVDDPMADPELAKDYRFGMELPPVTPFYSVQAVFPLDMSVDAQDMAEEARAARPEEEVPFSIREVDSDLNFQRNYLRKDTSFAPMEQAAKAILDANGAATHSEKLANLSKHKFIGREGDGTRAFAYDNLKMAGQAQLESRDKAAAAAYFGTADERVWVAKIREAEKQSVAHASMQGLTLGVYSFIAKRNALDNPFARGTYYVGMFRDIAGGMSKEDITNLDLWQNDILDSRKDAAEDVRGELLRMGREEFERALVSHHDKLRTDWLREQFAKRKTTAPLSVKEEAGDLLDKIFSGAFAQYWNRLKSPMGDVFQKELADAYGADNVALIVEQMEGRAAMFPNELTAPTAPKVKTPAAQAAEVLLAKAEEKYRKKLDQAIANDFKGELQAYYAQKIARALPVLSMDTAARAAALSPAERSAGIDKAFTALAQEAYADLLKRKDGKALAASGFLTLEGVTKDLEGIKAILKEREVAFTALSSALAAVMREANVTMADVLKASNETFGYVKTRLADDVKARVAEQLAKTVGMEEFPDAIDEAAARAGRAVEQMLETRLADWIEDGNNVQMRDYNASRRAAKTLVDVLSGANAPEMTAKPYSATSKGLAATLLGDAAMFKNALAATLQAAQTKAESLGQDILTPMAQALGLPATATLADIEAAVLSTRLPPAVARRAVEEHLASTGRTVIGLLEPLAHLEPGRVADELAAEFGADTKPLWEAALTKLMSDRSAAIVKRLGKKRDAAPARRKDLLDTLLFAAATGQFDDASLMEHVSKAAGLPVLSEAARTQLKSLVDDELKAIRETGDPDSSFVQPFTVKIARLLAGEAVRHWRAEGKKAGIFRFSKIDRDRLVAAFYASALSGPRTWLVTNPVGSTLKTLATLLELSAKNALLDRTLKKQGFRGALKAWSYMLKAANIDGIKAAIKDDMSPGRIRRRFEFGSAMAASSIDNPDPETRLFGAGPGVWGTIERFTYGLVQKYIPRFIRAGDVGPYGLGSDFGSYEAARKAALETNPDLTVEQADLEAKRILGYTSDGQIRPEFLAQAREEAARLFGGQVEEYKIRNRAREIATAQRPDYVQRVGDFIGGEGTFTSDSGVRHVMTPGMDQSVRNNPTARTKNFLAAMKNDPRPGVALTATALAPFTNIAIQVFDASLNYTLVPGIWRWKELQGKAAQDSITPEMQKSYEEAADLALTRMVHGTLVTIAAMLLAAASRDDDPWIELTGAGPSDFKKNWQWREAGGRPWTITLRKFGGWQVDFRTSPFFSILAAAGAWADQKHLSEDDRSNAVVAYGAGFFKSTLNQSFMSSASDLLGAITEADTEAGRQKLVSLFVNPVTTALVPASGLIRQVEEQFLPYPNVGRASGSAMETFLSTAISRIPLLNGFLPRKINALGRDVEGDRPTEVALGIQDWKRGSDEQAARVFDFSVAKRAWISVPNAIRTFVLPPDTALSKAEARRLADKDQALMTFAEYTAFMQRRGDIIVETFNKYEGELYKIEAGDKAAKVMDEIVSAAQDQAKRELLGLRPIKPGAVPADRKIRERVRDALRSEPGVD